MAVGITGGDPGKVNKAGDTMAGTLVLADSSPAASQAYVADHSVTSIENRTGAVTLSDLYDAIGAAAAARIAAEAYATAADTALQTASEAFTVAAIAGLDLGTAATHAAGDFATPASVAAAITALNLGTASQHATADFDAAGSAAAAQAAAEATAAADITALGLGTASTHAATDFATPMSVASAIATLGLGTASTHAATDFATPTTLAAAIAALALGTASQHATGDFDAAGAAATAQAYAIQRANETGTQLASTISDFATAVLLTAPPKTRAFTTGGLLTGGGDLSADRALSTLGLGCQPDDMNFIDWSFDPAFASSSGAVPTSGLLYVQKMRQRTAQAITKISTITGVTGTQPTNVGVAIFDPSGNVYSGATATPAPATWNTLGEHDWTLGTPPTPPVGFYYIAMFVNGASSASIIRINNSGLTTTNNAGLSGTAAGTPATALRSSSANSGITTMPSSLTALSAVAQTWWFGVR